MQGAPAGDSLKISMGLGKQRMLRFFLLMARLYQPVLTSCLVKDGVMDNRCAQRVFKFRFMEYNTCMNTIRVCNTIAYRRSHPTCFMRYKAVSGKPKVADVSV